MMTRCKFRLWLMLGLLAAAAGARGAPPPPNALQLSKLSLTAKAHLGEVTFTYHITPVNRSADVGIQIFAKRDDVPGSQFDLIAPNAPGGGPLVISLYKGLDNTGTFVARLPKGKYGGCRVLLFESPDGKGVDFGRTVFDNAGGGKLPAVDLKLTVLTGAAPVKAPVLSVSETPTITPNADGTSSVVIAADVRVPPGYQAESGGFWVMAKGSGGFDQTWAAMNSARSGGDPLDPYQSIPVKLTLKNVPPGIGNVQFGLFKYSFGDALQWVWPGLDYEVGGDTWVQRAPPKTVPPRLRVKGGKFVTLDGKPHNFYSDAPAARRAVSFVRGGNYGNAIVWTLTPELNRPGYFVLLRDLGCRFIRVNFNPDRYPQPIYQHAVDQVVQNIWAAGLYPLLAPQDLPQGESVAKRVEKGLRVVKLLTSKYEGKSVWIELCNEPHVLDTWAAWKPVAIEYARAIREIDPNAFIVAPFEGYGKDGRAAAKDPLPKDLVDVYDGHAYVGPQEVAARFGTAIQAGLPVLIGEYGGGNASYLAQMNHAFQSLSPAPLAIAPWAFTIAGQDSLPLIANGATATLKFTPPGQAVANAYDAWGEGRKIGK